MSLPLALESTLIPGGILLPLELHHQILDNLWNQKSSLSSSSVVCKSWLPICRKLLFDQIVLRSDFAHFLRDSPQNSQSISGYIRKVIFTDDFYWPDTDFCLSNLPRLRELTIARSTFQRVQSPQPTPGFLTLTKLEIKSTNFPSFYLFTQYIDLFSSLEDLTLDNLSWDQLGCNSWSGFSDQGPDIKPLSIQRLSVEFCCNYQVILNWLRHGVISEASLDITTGSRRTLDRLSSLSLTDVLPHEASQILSFVETTGESLECLELGFVVRGTESDHDVTNAVNRASKFLSTLHLQSLTLSQIILFLFPFYSTPVTPSNSSVAPTLDSPYAWIPSLLEAALSNGLTHLTMNFWLSSEAQMDLVDWTRIDRSTSASPLSSIHFRISGMGREFVSVKHWFKARLPLLTDSSKVVVEFIFCDDIHCD